MTADEKIALIRQKVEGANQHIRDLKIASDTFINTQRYTFTTEYNAETIQTEYYAAHDLEVVPYPITLIVGDAIHNLRSALDHLAFQLWLSSPLRAGDGRHVYYPIAENAAKYQTEHLRRVKGMTQDAIDAIGATEPYQDGQGKPLWIINELDIVDKHRSLLIADVSVTVFRAVPPMERRTPTSMTPPNFRTPAKAGDLLFTVDPRFYQDVNLTYSIAFSESSVVEGKSVLVTLQQLSDVTDNLILGFKPLLV